MNFVELEEVVVVLPCTSLEVVVVSLEADTVDVLEGGVTLEEDFDPSVFDWVVLGVVLYLITVDCPMPGVVLCVVL